MDNVLINKLGVAPNDQVLLSHGFGAWASSQAPLILATLLSGALISTNVQNVSHIDYSIDYPILQPAWKSKQ